MKDINPHIQEVQQTSSKINIKKITPRYIIDVSFLKIKDKKKILKSAKEITYSLQMRKKRKKLIADFSKEILEAENKPGMVVHACNPSTLRGKVGRSLEVRSSRPAWPT